MTSSFSLPSSKSTTTPKTKSAKGHRPLGKGLSALLSDISLDSKDLNSLETRLEGKVTYQVVAIKNCQSGPYQPRKQLNLEGLEQLALSIKEKGVIQPIILRQREPEDLAEAPGALYEVVAGERRLEASKIAQLEEIPAMVLSISVPEAYELAIVENIQREDLNPLEEAYAYQRLMEQFNYTQELLAQALGKSRAYVGHVLRYRNLPEPVQTLLAQGDLTASHAKLLMGIEEKELCEVLAYKVVSEHLSVRALTELVHKAKEGKLFHSHGELKELSPLSTEPLPTKERYRKSLNEKAWENCFKQEFKLQASFKAKSEVAGELRFMYKTAEEKERLLEVMNKLLKS